MQWTYCAVCIVCGERHNTVECPFIRASVCLSLRSAAAAPAGGFAAEGGSRQQIPINDCCCWAMCGSRKFSSDCNYRSNIGYLFLFSVFSVDAVPSLTGPLGVSRTARLNSFPSKMRESSPCCIMPHFWAIDRAVLTLSPVTMRTVIPASLHFVIASGTCQWSINQSLARWHSKRIRHIFNTNIL